MSELVQLAEGMQGHITVTGHRSQEYRSRLRIDRNDHIDVASGHFVDIAPYIDPRYINIERVLRHIYIRTVFVRTAHDFLGEDDL